MRGAPCLSCNSGNQFADAFSGLESPLLFQTEHFALEDPPWMPMTPWVYACLRRTVVDVGTQGGGTRPSRYHSLRAISAPFRRPEMCILIPWPPVA